MKNSITLVLLFAISFLSAQTSDITTELYETYENYKTPELTKRRIKHHQIQPLIEDLKSDAMFTVKKVGESIEGRSLSLISIGTGKTSVYLWSQMHGDEPTATQAIFDIFNFLQSDDFVAEKEAILSNLTLHFLPMLNPDGAEVYTRRNALGIDLNRDALRLQSPESNTLKRVRDSLSADFGFNLHDQSRYYNAERTNKPATISYLAPAYNYEKEINEVRGNAMKVIVFMNSIIQKYAPGQVGRYNDDFEPRAFGDNIQKWGTSTILIESGGYADDIEKQEIRKLNYVSILSAIYSIATQNYKKIALDEYEKIPQNDRKLFDLKIENATHILNGKKYILDVASNRLEVDLVGHDDYWFSSRILELGDLSTYYGYQTFDATGYTIKAGAINPKMYNTIAEIPVNEIKTMLRQGYTYTKVMQIPAKALFSPLPMHIVSSKYKLPNFNVTIGQNPTFLLEKNGKIDYAVINGFLIDVRAGAKDSEFNNAMIYR